jgi:serine/threonine protein kinase
VAPELLQGQSSGTAADLWSLGCIVFELLVGVSPFKASTTEATISRIKSGNVEFSLNITPLAVDFIQSLLLCDPNLRMGVDDAEELTSHIFLQGVIFNRIFSAPAPDYSVEMKKIAPVAEKVVKEEVVKKKCGWIYKKRILRLCDTPCLKYFDPAKGECRGIIEVNPQIKVEVKGKSEFVITIPKRSYFFKDLSNNAEDWKNLISNQINRVYGKY